MKKLVFIVSFLLLSGSLFAQTTRTPVDTRDVHGIVKDVSGKAIANANIALISASDTLKVMTNSDGVFTFSNVKKNVFLVFISDNKHVSFAEKFRVSDSFKNVTLDPIVLRSE